MPSRRDCRTLALCLVLAWSLAAVDRLPAQGKPALTDALGDPLPPGAVARLGTARYKVADSIRALALSSDGELLVGGSSVLHFWKARTGQPVRGVIWLEYGFEALALAPDGKSLATSAGTGNLCHWDV